MSEILNIPEDGLVIISGGQVGVDQAGLEVAIKLDLPHGGWCPKGRIQIGGIIPRKYKLQEHSSSKYPPRTKANVESSDGTMVFYLGKKGRGTKLTIKHLLDCQKPLFEIDLERPTEVDEVIQWAKENEIRVFNIAGTRNLEAAEPTQEFLTKFFQGLLA